MAVQASGGARISTHKQLLYHAGVADDRRETSYTGEMSPGEARRPDPRLRDAQQRRSDGTCSLAWTPWQVPSWLRPCFPGTPCSKDCRRTACGSIHPCLSYNTWLMAWHNHGPRSSAMYVLSRVILAYDIFKRCYTAIMGHAGASDSTTAERTGVYPHAARPPRGSALPSVSSVSAVSRPG